MIIINVLFFIGTISMGKLTSFVDLFSMHFPMNEGFRPWQLITHMFMHASKEHIFFNMFLLWMVGSPTEFAIGQKKFIFLYFSAGLGGVLLPLLIDYIQYFSVLSDLQHLGFNNDVMRAVINAEASNGGTIQWSLMYDEIGPILQANNVNLSGITETQIRDLLKLNGMGQTISLGASGAIFGILTAFGLYFAERTVYLLIPPIPLKVKYLVVGMVGADFISAILTGTPLVARTNVAYLAHIGGAITGFLIAWYWKRTQFNKHRWN